MNVPINAFIESVTYELSVTFFLHLFLAVSNHVDGFVFCLPRLRDTIILFHLWCSEITSLPGTHLQ